MVDDDPAHTMMPNLLFFGITIAYKIQVLSLSWLMIDEEDLKRFFNQQDVTRRPRGKVELWFCNEVQGLVKTMVK